MCLVLPSIADCGKLSFNQYCTVILRVMMLQERITGCSKWPFSKAAGESKPEAYPLGYVEDFDELRTKLADFFSILREKAHS